MDENRLLNLLNGDLKYFDEFYNETRYKVFYNILSVIKDHQISEDLLQETYIRFLNNLSNLKKEKNIIGYLFVTSRNLALDYIKKNNRIQSLNEYDESLIKESVFINEFTDIFIRCKELLSDIELEVVIMHVINDMTHKEIAELTKKPLGTITWTYNNAIKKLQKGMKDYE